jgi:predicted nucleotide-binding protein (sugar kinase/HSP70/actin superfamily)
MSVLPEYAHGRISIPWWYGLGYVFGWTTAGIIGIRRNETMEIILDNLTIIAMVVCALIGSLAFTVFMAISKYEKQKTDAEKLRTKIAEGGRDPTDPASLTSAEKWELTKASKFDRIFIIADAMTVILGTALACIVLILANERIGNDWEYYAVYGLILGILATWFLYETVIKSVAAGEWQKKSADAFRIVKSVADETAEMNGGYAALVEKLVKSGVKKKQADKLAKEMIVANPDLLKEE